MSRQTRTTVGAGFDRSRTNAGKKLLISSTRYSGTPVSRARFRSSSSGRQAVSVLNLAEPLHDHVGNLLFVTASHGVKQ